MVAGRFGAGGGFLAAATAGAGDAAGRGAAAGAFGAAAAAAGGGAGFGADIGGSGDMMLTAGVFAEVGNSALVGLPVGITGGSAASRPLDACCAGAFHDAV